MEKHFFHIHTYRCRHAEDVPDEIYILKALEFPIKEKRYQ